MKKAIVTGGAGFIGSHLVDYLLGRGVDVTIIDNLATGSEENIRGLCFQSSVSDADLWDRVPRVDVVFHLASPADVRHCEMDPVGVLAANVDGTRNALEYCRRNGARLLFTSSSEIYGEPMVHPQPENYWGNVSSVGERSCYDEGKRCGEALCMAYSRQYGVQTRIARLFNCYGPRMVSADVRVVPQFIRAIIEGRRLPICGTGMSTRTFCYVSDTVRGLVMLAESDYSSPVNLGSDWEISMMSLASLVGMAVGRSVRVDHLPERPDDPTRRRPDCTVAHTVLGWEPEVSLEEGLRLTVEWTRHENSTKQDNKAGTSMGY